MNIKNEKLPGPKELEKELNDYLNKKYGKHFKFGVTSTLSPEPESQKSKNGEVQEQKSGAAKINFNIKPEELEAYLDEYIIKQKKAKQILATKICTHFNRIRALESSKRFSDDNPVGSIKNNIIMIGPTGVGKTYMIKLIAKKIGVPFVKGDATKFSETGYVGGDVEDLVRDLVAEANGDIELAQYGIIYLDEVDKIASSQNFIGPDVSRTGVQRALLKPMEETEVELRVPHDIISQMEALEHYRRTGEKQKQKINTKNILFIMSGAFNGLEEIIKKRLNRQGIGFGAEIRSKKDEEGSLLPLVKAEDFINYGFESEFIGRLPVIVVLEKLEVDDLYEILRNINSPIILGKKKDFKAYGIDIKFEDKALYKIAQNAYQEKTGARGLVSAIEKVLLPFERKLPSTNIKRLVVTPEMVDSPESELEKTLQDPENLEREERFQKVAHQEAQRLKKSILARKKEFINRYGVLLDEKVIELITYWVMEQGISVSAAYQEAINIRQQVKNFEKKFAEINGLEISFSEDVLNGILERVIKENKDPWEVCQTICKNYEYGLKLIKEKTGVSNFVIHKEALHNPEEYLNSLIRSSYSR
ncbi:MAG: AAA family ATPase [Desulfobacterota bacterium]|nr:AAA family ATPase [Thermodesulfobacteriota bacterium]